MKITRNHDKITYTEYLLLLIHHRCNNRLKVMAWIHYQNYVFDPHSLISGNDHIIMVNEEGRIKRLIWT